MTKIEQLEKFLRKEGSNVSNDFLDDLKECFSMAEEMCGCHHPDEIDNDRAMIRITYKKVLLILRDWTPPT